MGKQKWLSAIPREKGFYFAGFVDGEGSFNVSLRKRSDHTMRWQVVLTFNVSQRESYILSQFKRYLGCGTIRRRSDGIYTYTVSNPTSIMERIIPFFEKYPFLSQKKKRDFSLFKQIAQLVSEKQHLAEKGLERIVRLREKLNEGRGRKRRYTLRDYQKDRQENPQRLYAKPRAFRPEERG